MIFGKDTNIDCNQHRSIQNLFSAHIGLHLSMQKSSIIIAPSTPSPLNIASLLFIANITTNFIYLGIPITLGKYKILDFSPLLENITNLLSGKKARLLSLASRIQFVKYTITNNVAY